MTEPGAVRVTVARVCPDDAHDVRLYMPGNICTVCHGTGVVWEPVTCAGCRKFHKRATTGYWCSDLEVSTVDPDFACSAWEPREPRS